MPQTMKVAFYRFLSEEPMDKWNDGNEELNLDKSDIAALL